jgi:hypothetical protein
MPAKVAVVCKFEKLLIGVLARQLESNKVRKKWKHQAVPPRFGLPAPKEIAQHKCAKRRRTTGTMQARPIAIKGRLDGSGVETMVSVPIIVLLPGRWYAV